MILPLKAHLRTRVLTGELNGKMRVSVRDARYTTTADGNSTYRGSRELIGELVHAGTRVAFFVADYIHHKRV